MIKIDAKLKVLDWKALGNGLRRNRIALLLATALVLFFLFYKEVAFVAMVYQSDIISIACWLASQLTSNFDFAFQLSEVRLMVDSQILYFPFFNNQTYVVGIYILFLSSIRICKNIYKRRFWKYMAIGVFTFSLVRIITYTLALVILQKVQCNGYHLSNAINTLTHMIDYCILYQIGKRYIKKLKFISNKPYPYFH